MSLSIHRQNTRVIRVIILIQTVRLTLGAVFEVDFQLIAGEYVVCSRRQSEIAGAKSPRPQVAESIDCSWIFRSSTLE